MQRPGLAMSLVALLAASPAWACLNSMVGLETDTPGFEAIRLLAAIAGGGLLGVFLPHVGVARPGLRTVFRVAVICGVAWAAREMPAAVTGAALGHAAKQHARRLVEQLLVVTPLVAVVVLSVATLAASDALATSVGGAAVLACATCLAFSLVVERAPSGLVLAVRQDEVRPAVRRRAA